MCQDCENEEVHISPLDDIEDIESVNELNNERDDNKEYYDTVLDNFYQKNDTRNRVSDVIAEQIVTNCANKKVIVAQTDTGHFWIKKVISISILKRNVFLIYFQKK